MTLSDFFLFVSRSSSANLVAHSEDSAVQAHQAPSERGCCVCACAQDHTSTELLERRELARSTAAALHPHPGVQDQLTEARDSAPSSAAVFLFFVPRPSALGDWCAPLLSDVTHAAPPPLAAPQRRPARAASCSAYTRNTHHSRHTAPLALSHPTRQICCSNIPRFSPRFNYIASAHLK
jgi:hypothetical protein